MSKHKFRTVVKALITNNGKILIGKKEEDEEHPVSGQWHLLEGRLGKGDQFEEAVKREVKEETGLEVEVHQIVDIETWSSSDKEKDSVRALYHVESDSRDAEVSGTLEEVKWVSADDLVEELGEKDASRMEESSRQEKFVEKLRKAPVF